jgi:hypothetical protein
MTQPFYFNLIKRGDCDQSRAFCVWGETPGIDQGDKKRPPSGCRWRSL